MKHPLQEATEEIPHPVVVIISKTTTVSDVLNIKILSYYLYMALWAPLALAEYLLFILSAVGGFLENK
jgi:hypothetical protein